ncbi:MAG: radical SAM protein [Mogibacterium sp.]|nr:radical SAM protein [Mogibacterium sp.]
MNVSSTIKQYGLKKVIDNLYKDPEKVLPRLMDWADRFSGGDLEKQRRAIRAAIEDKNNAYYPFIRHLIKDVDHDVLTALMVNYFINAGLAEWKKQEELRNKYDCNIPWTVLLDPTSACNLNCVGCWAAEYGNNLNLSLEEIDDIIRQGKEMGVYMYIYTGGEPLVRKQDLIRICEIHDDCVFLCFTNGTLIDEEFADEMLRVKNFVPAISVEGFSKTTDSRRGDGVYEQVITAMELLHSKKLVYGISTCYTSENWESVTSEEYFDMMIENGAYFVWYFHYMPVGNDASPKLLLDPEQREEVYRRIRKLRSEKPLFSIDFQNDAEYIGGCIAGGRRYLHINANGDIDPCVFIHYSDSNIREKTLLEAMQSPLFKEYHDKQPFNENMLRPCPMLENPKLLREIVRKTGAKSTDLTSPETADHLCSKCDLYAARWKPKAEELWEERTRTLQGRE